MTYAAINTAALVTLTPGLLGRLRAEITGASRSSLETHVHPFGMGSALHI